MLSEETILSNNWDAHLLAQPFKKKFAENYGFENTPLSHHKLFVQDTVSINEFIIMLKQRFFKDTDIQLEDIWLYRII